MKTTDIAKLKTAFLADVEQYHIDALTPDRGYPVPVDNLEKFIDDAQADLSLQVQKLKAVMLKAANYIASVPDHPGYKEIACMLKDAVTKGQP